MEEAPITHYEDLPVSDYTINFHTTENPVLPEWFTQTDNYRNNDLKMCIGAGDNPDNIRELNSFDVFVCLPDLGLFNRSIRQSIQLASERNKLICFCRLGDDIQTPRLVNLFRNRVSLLDTDDKRVGRMFGLENAHAILKPGGICMFNLAEPIDIGPGLPQEEVDRFFRCRAGPHPLGVFTRFGQDGAPGVSVDADINNLPICTKIGGNNNNNTLSVHSNNSNNSNNGEREPIQFVTINGIDTFTHSHLIDFNREENPTIPDWFAEKTCLKVCIAAGDGIWRGECTDIQRIPEYDVYCCYEGRDDAAVLMNLQYILDYYYQQKIICFMSALNPNHLDKFARMLQNKCNLIASDDTRIYLLPDNWSKTLLINGGKLIDYNVRLATRDNPMGRVAIDNTIPSTLPEAPGRFECVEYTYNGNWQICTKIL